MLSLLSRDNFLKIYFTSLSFILFLVPIFYAQAEVVKLKNPLKVDTIEDLLIGILNIVMVIATPIIIFFIIYAGFMYVTAAGNPEKIKKATNALTYAIIGGVIIIGAIAIGEIIKNLVGAFEVNDDPVGIYDGEIIKNLFKTFEA